MESCIYCGHNEPDEIFKIEDSDSYVCAECAEEYGVPLEQKFFALTITMFA